MKRIHSDYTQVPLDKALDQIIYDLEVAAGEYELGITKRKLEVEDFPSLELVTKMKDINVQYDYSFAKKFYLRMVECFMEEEAWIASREFSSSDDEAIYHMSCGFALPCDYQEDVYEDIGFSTCVRPRKGCPYCPYEGTFWGCRYRGDFSPVKKILYIRRVSSNARRHFNTRIPNEEQFNYICQHIKDFEPNIADKVKRLDYRRAKLIWKKSYELLANWPLKKGVNVKE